MSLNVFRSRLSAEAVFLLLLWKWLNVSSIALFSRKALGIFTAAKKDVMNDLLKREDIKDVVDNFDRISEEPLFKSARLRARDDCQGVGIVELILDSGLESAQTG